MRRSLLAALMACASLVAAPALGQVAYTTTDPNNPTARLTVPVSPSKGLPMRQSTLTPLGYQQITSLSSATALTVPTGATVAYVTVEGQGIRWRDDGTNPTASVGAPVSLSQQLIYFGNLAAIKFIQQAASATIDVEYYQ